MSNPLLEQFNNSNTEQNSKPNALPDFDAISLEHFEPAIEQLIADSEAQIAELVKLEHPSWGSLVLPFQRCSERLSDAWAILSLYNSVLNSDELRPIYERLLAKITAFHTSVSLNADLYQAYAKLAESEAFSCLDEAQQASIEHVLRDFRLSGVALPEADKPRYAELSQRISSLQNQFSQNVLDATQGWSKWLADASDLAGLPESSLAMFAAAAKDKGHDGGYLLSLDIPSYLPVMTYCQNRALRQELYSAYMTRASDQGPDAGKWDNSAIIEELMSLRQEQSAMLGFKHYAERSVASKMAESSEQVIEFLNDLAQKSKPSAEREFAQLSDFARAQGGPAELEMWDLAYYSEQLKQAEYGFSKEQLRPYFPAEKVLNGMFKVAATLFDIEIKENTEAARFHPDARYFEIWQQGQLQAGFYVDLYARQGKRGGAWLASCRSRYRDANTLHLPIAFLTCNFTPASADSPSLLTPEEVTTLFHEFGHCLHYTLTDIDVANVAGIRNVPWDAVELPSQMLENWCFEERVLPWISGHIETGEVVPSELLAKLKRSQQFQGGMMMVRQLEFALFDFRLHMEFEAGHTDIQGLSDQVREQVAVRKPPEFTRFSHAFGHIFAGGYAAGYYSYKWAEVLSADAFSRFDEEGLLDPAIGCHFKDAFLSRGGSRDVMAMFKDFRGREPKVEPLLQLAGIS